MKIPKRLSAFQFYKNLSEEAKKKKRKERRLSRSDPQLSFNLENGKNKFSNRSLEILDSSLPPSKKVRFLDEVYPSNDTNNELITEKLDNQNKEKSHHTPLLLKSKVGKRRHSLPEQLLKKVKTNIQEETLGSKLKASFIEQINSSKMPKIDIKEYIEKKVDDDIKSDTKSFSIPPYLADSREQSKKCFQWLINPYDVDNFFRHNWEKQPLLLKRSRPIYYTGIFSTEVFDKILRERNLIFTKNIDLTLYENDEKKVLNPDGKAYPAVVWDHYENGCSVRLLNPQAYSKAVWKLNSILQEFFGSTVGANVYLTPPGSQGFAPHYDDIEAFILQLEGKKIWKIYAPMDESQVLPRYSSKNFKRSELNAPLLTTELCAGDLLYFPRGFIHEARTSEDSHSLHITISMAQKSTYGDLLEVLIPQALSSAIEDDVEYRESLPIDFMRYMGAVHCDKVHADRDSFLSKVKHLMDKLFDHARIDGAVDQIVKNFIHKALPPVLTTKEKLASIHGSGEYWNSKEQRVEGSIELEPDTQIKLIRYGVMRYVIEEGNKVRLYHCLENSYDPNHEMDVQYVDIDDKLAPGVEYLIDSYPNYVTIESLPLKELDQKLELGNLLFDKGLIVIIEKDESD